ncbi:MAG TPA: glycosyltransferase family 39 protein [Blastocatellia bacterium]|nr:glycosyltransferase family 39 protein [Blastocatellia bacterium]
MTDASLADRKNEFRDEHFSIPLGTTLKVFGVIVVVSFLLRIVYAGHLYEDDGMWLTAGEEIVRGKALYSEIYFDKPPGLALVYALLSCLFGAHIIVVRLFTIGYSIAVAGLIYLFGSRLYDKRVGLLAAVMFSVFSTTYVTGHVQSLSTDLLMSLPYTAAAYLMARSMSETISKRGAAWLAAAGGICAGLAFQINPKGLLALVFFAIALIAARKWNQSAEEQARDEIGESRHFNTPLLLFVLAVAGFVAGSLPFFAYIGATGSSQAYWLYVWDWGARYGSYYGTGEIVLTALARTADYLALNNTLFIALAFVVVAAVRRRQAGEPVAKRAPGASVGEYIAHQSDVTLLIWLAVSYAGVMIGGRFFGHYFIQILPALCLIGARGLIAIHASLRERSAPFRQSVVVLIALGFAFTLVRFHGRGVLLAADLVRGTVSKTNQDWYYNQRAREERMVAAVVRDLAGGAGAADELGLESIRAGGPRDRAPEGPEDYLFVWGYRPEIYYWSGLLPASRFLSTQPLTGVPADVHYFRDAYRSVLDQSVTEGERAQLLRDLEATQPKYIVDEIGFFNNDLAILRYPELREFLSAYKSIGATGRFFVYVRNDLRRKYQLRHSTGSH